MMQLQNVISFVFKYNKLPLAKHSITTVYKATKCVSLTNSFYFNTLDAVPAKMNGSGECQASHPDPKIMGLLSKLIFWASFCS